MGKGEKGIWVGRCLMAEVVCCGLAGADCSISDHAKSSGCTNCSLHSACVTRACTESMHSVITCWEQAE